MMSSALLGAALLLAPVLPTAAAEMRPQSARRTAQSGESAGPTVVELSRLEIPRVVRAPTLTEFLNDRPREAEAVVTDFRQRQPGDGVPVSQTTTAYLSYTDKNLYIVFVCEDQTDSVRGHMAKREEVGADDLVGIYLDTFRDRRHAYAFEANPLGLQRDALINEGQRTDYTFDTLWQSEGRLTERGYVVWMAIPFKSLRFSNAALQTWGIALMRKILRTNEEAFWPYITLRVPGFVNHMATLDGMKHISSHDIQFTPYGTFTGSTFLDKGRRAFRVQNEGHGGLDSKFVIKDALTLDVTVGPDFSQVESDEPQVTVNQRFEVQFPEKRPFFMENAGYFQTPVNLVYSRRIIDPQLGARLTGKVGGWALGALFMDDRAQGKVLADGDALHGDRAGVGIVRVQREFGSQSSAGMLVTSRDFGSSSNRVLAFDTRLKLGPNWYFTGQMMKSATRDPDGSRRDSGPAYWGQLRYGGRQFTHFIGYTDFSPSFRSELGFVKRVDLRTLSEYAGYLWYPAGKRLLSFGPSITASAVWDHQRQLQDWNVYPAFVLNFARQTGLEFSHSQSHELFGGAGFRRNLENVSFYTSLAKWLGVYASYARGTAINYSPAAGLSPSLGDVTTASLALTWRPTERVRMDHLYIYTGLGSRVSPAGVPSSDGIFDNHLARWKVNYQFTRALSARAIFDYYALLPNAALINDDRSKVFTGDVLLTYLVHPGTALHVGYTNRLENLAIEPTVPARLRFTTSPITATTRQFFIKVSYLFRL
jgi:uncharacterized protein DUF5916